MSGAGAIADCPFDQPPEDDICAQLRKKIDDLINRNKHENGGKGTHGLSHRFRELISRLGKGDTSTYETHRQEILNQQKALEQALNRYNQNGCGDPPPTVWSWRLREVPKPSDYRETAENAAKSAAVVGGAAVVAYIAYRAIRLLPSLAPPLWPTLPINLAVP